MWMEPVGPLRHVLVPAVSAAVVGAFVGWFCRGLRDQRHRPPQAPSGVAGPFLAASLTVTTLVSLVSIVDLPRLKSLLASLKSPYFFNYTVPVAFVVYCGIVCFCGISLIARAIRPGRGDLLLVVWLLALVWGQGTSFFWYVLVACPVATPLAMYLLKRNGFLLDGRILGGALGLTAAIVHVAFPSPLFPPAFQPLHRLPPGTPFAGLYAATWYSDTVGRLVEKVSPQIRGRSTLWFSRGGPHLAYGGEPARDAPLLYKDTYSPRSEKALIESWEAAPPDFAVYTGFSPAPGSQYLTPGFILHWLPIHYDLVLEDKGAGLSVWRRRGLRGPASE
jgi:hypothetical protein